MEEGRSSGYVEGGKSGVWTPGFPEKWEGVPTPALNVYLMRVTLFLFYSHPDFPPPIFFPHALPHSPRAAGGGNWVPGG